MGDFRGQIEEASQTRRSHYYTLVTIRCNLLQHISIETLLTHYHDLIHKFTKYGAEWSDNYGIELTKKNTLHLHTYCTSRVLPWCKSPIGWSYNLKLFPVEDISTVIRYINKWGTEHQQREYESYIYHQDHRTLFNNSSTSTAPYV